MTNAKAGTNANEPELVRFTRAPVDRLFLGCVLAACVGYVGFLIAMALAPEQPEGEAKQSFLGVVTGESQPPGGGPGEADPAEGVAVRGGAGSAHYAGGGRPRPVILIDGEASPRRGSSQVAAGEGPVVTGPVAVGSAAGGSGGPGRLTGPLADLALGLSVDLSAQLGQRGLEVWRGAETDEVPDVDEVPEVDEAPEADEAPETQDG